MEIVNIEARTFEAMLSKFEVFADRMEKLCTLYGDMSQRMWLDNQDVCLMLNISPRTLQTLRDNGTLPYSQICHKTYYKPEDVERIVRLWRIDASERGMTKILTVNNPNPKCL